MMKMNRFIFAALLIFCAVVARADQDFESWKTDFYQQALSHKVSNATLDKYFLNAEYLPRVIELDRAQPEFTSSFGNYMKRAVSDTRISKAKQLLKNHSRILGRVEELYGVPAHYLLAFWGVETNFGAIKGKVNTLNALATLAFDPRRSGFFSEQLVTLLKILEREHIDVPTGSWAGAFGHFQFMPTTFYQYAVDEDGDGRADIIHSFDDAVASAANYLNKMGWQRDQTWGREVVLSDFNVVEKLGEKHTLKEWNKWGVKRADGQAYKPQEEDILAELLMPEGVNGPAFLTYKNFDVIKRWNRSDFYALAIVVLADNIIDRDTLNIAALDIKPNLKNEDVKAVQQALKNKNMYDGKTDGRMGSGTKKALKAYQKANHLPADGFLSVDLFNKITNQKGDK